MLVCHTEQTCNSVLKYWFIYRGTRTHSSKLLRPSCPSEPRPHEKTCPLSFRASVWDAPHDTAMMICASRATTCSNGRQRDKDKCSCHVHYHKTTIKFFFFFYSLTWFLSALLMSQLPEVIAATGVHCPILQQEGCVSVATPHITHLLPVEEFTSSWLDHNLLINPTHA